MTLLNKLTTWQKDQARREGVDGYMVLPFAALKLIAQELPRSEEELLAIKGIGPVKVKKYGHDILTMVAGGEVAASSGRISHSDLLAQQSIFSEADVVNSLLDDKVEDFLQTPEELSYEAESVQEISGVNTATGEIVDDETEVVMSVSDFLGRVNQVLGSYFSQVKIRGEIIGFKRNANGHAYFEIKDDDAIVRVSVFKNTYDFSGVTLADGMEVIVTGTPEHHARYGFSVIGSFVELAGEGALKKAYDELKKKLATEGLFSADKKRALPELPQRIGLITSPTGAAIGDFTTNVGAYGYKIIFHPSRVEGAQAVKDLLVAIKKMTAQDLDLLIITRGGGSLESLAAFNNENVVRALADFPAPVIAGIGHEQDETLSTLVADVGVSTPTAAARAVRESWDRAITQLESYKERLISVCDAIVRDMRDVQERSAREIENFFTNVHRTFTELEYDLTARVDMLGEKIAGLVRQLDFWEASFVGHNPLRLLKLGYSITRNAAGKVIHSASDVAKDDIIEIQVEDGKISSQVR